jgi:hypothetical protein
MWPKSVAASNGGVLTADVVVGLDISLADVEATVKDLDLSCCEQRYRRRFGL